jgi:hypothetical protein
VLTRSQSPCCISTLRGFQDGSEWTEGRRYLGLDVIARSRLTLLTTHSEPAVEPAVEQTNTTGQVTVA